MKFTAVQMVGTQRSGSNLLRLMLNQLPEISAPHPPHIIERFMPLLSGYGDLSFSSNFRNLVADVCQLVAFNPVVWPSMKLNADALLKRCEEPTLVEITRVIYEEKARSEGARIWMCKSMSNIHFVNDLETSLQPLYIFLYRDGRDVACSFKKAIVGEKHVYHIAKQWKAEQNKCLALQDYISEERFIAVCYEKLIANPEKELRKICTFLGVEYHPDCLQYFGSEEAKNTASSGDMWHNVEQHVLSGNFNKYGKELLADEIKLFETVAGDALVKLGYTLDFDDCGNETITEEKIKIFASSNKELKQQAKQKQTPEDAEKRRKQDAFLYSLQTKSESSVYNKLQLLVH